MSSSSCGPACNRSMIRSLGLRDPTDGVDRDRVVDDDGRALCRCVVGRRDGVVVHVGRFRTGVPTRVASFPYFEHTGSNTETHRRADNA